jgi:hypothetical protein
MVTSSHISDEFQALVAAENELVQHKLTLLEEDKADPSVIAKTLELEQLIRDNQLAIAETNKQLQTAFRTPHRADDAMEISSPQPEKEPGTKAATKGNPPYPPSCSKENVLGKDHLSQRNQYNNFFRLQDVINAYRGTSTKIVILDDEYPMFTES